MTRSGLVALAALAALGGCSARPMPADLARAEAHERAGQPDAALQAYRDAQVSCRDIRPEWRRRQTCATAHLQYAELLVTLGRHAEAARTYEELPRALEGAPGSSARATYEAGRLYLELGEPERAWTLLWKTVTDYPDEAHAGDALKVLLKDGRRRNPRQLYDVLAGLAEPLADSGAGDNVLHALAVLAEEELDDAGSALRHYDRLVERYPGRKHSGLYDDALWHGARLARGLGDARGAVRRYQQLLATREVAFGVGSYFSVWLDDAQLALGQVLRDDLGDTEGALAAFAQLPEDYPDSVLVDDARWEAAVTLAAAGRGPEACVVLADLAERFPDSRYQLERAPALGRQLGCAGAAAAVSSEKSREAREE